MASGDGLIQKSFIFLAIFAFIYVTPPLVESQMCSKLEFCQDVLPYNQTIYPNGFNNTNQEDAKTVYFDFQPLIATRCSKELKLFLCFSYAPPCTILNRYIPVCRSFCETAVTKECLNILKKMSFTKPRVFECHHLPSGGNCIQSNKTAPSLPDTGSESPTIFPPVDPYTWYPDEGSFELIDSDTQVDLFFLATSGNYIQLLKIRTPNNMDTLNIFRDLDSNMRTPIDYYLPQKFVYWASQLNGRIYRGKLHVETLRDIVPVVDTGAANVESLVVDWNLCVLFWSESVPAARIRTASLSGRGVRTIVEKRLTYPISLNVDPVEGLVFWIDRKGDEFSSYSIIESFSVVTNRRRLIFNITSDIFGERSRPRSLVADIDDKKLFWVDARSQSLHSISYDGSGHKTLLEDEELLHEPDNLVISDDKIIWTDKLSKSLVWANKHTGEDLVPIKRFYAYVPQNLRLYGKNNQKNATTYNKDKLSDDWKELSSRESMEVPDLDDGDWDEYDEDDDDDDDEKKKNGGQFNSISFSSLSVLGAIVIFFFNLLQMDK